MGILKTAVGFTTGFTESRGAVILESIVHLSAEGADFADGRVEMPASDARENFAWEVHGTSDPSS